MATKSVRIDADVLQAALKQKPHYLTPTAYLSDLLAKSLPMGLPRVPTITEHPDLRDTDPQECLIETEGCAVSTSYIPKKKFIFKVPDDLVWCDELLDIYWKEGKKGAKTERAAKFLFEELGKIESAYGKQVVIDQLKAATANRWESITALNYERFGLPSGTTSTSDSEPHRSNAGCYRDFTAERLERERLEIEAANA